MHATTPVRSALITLLVSSLAASSVYADNPREETTSQLNTAVDVVPAEMPSVGSPDALVTVLVISEFQCPFCSRVNPTLARLLVTYGDRIRLVWANNPLSFHNKAMPAALAALAAHRQGLFWQMHKKLFANQRQLTDANLARWAAEIGCDLTIWQRDRADPALRRQIKIEQRAAMAVGARGTPGFLINGKRISGAQPYKKFADEIDKALDAAAVWRGSNKTGLELMEAMWGERGGEQGVRAVGWFFAGVEPPARPTRTARPAYKPKPISKKIWKVPVGARDHIEGNSRKALVTIVEFSDLQCPYCSRAAATLKKIRKQYGDKVRIVFKHHPLSFHNRARPAHKAAIAAARQGKYLEFRDKAFSNRHNLSEKNLTKWARELGLRMKRFNRDRSSSSAEARIKKDTALALSIGLRGTPSFIINGRQLRGAQPVAAFRKLIDEEIVKAQSSGKRGKAYYRQLMAKAK